jgi:hypothetical protein
MPDRTFSYRQGELVAEVFGRHGVEYLFIGKSGAIFYGYPERSANRPKDRESLPRLEAFAEYLRSKR